MNSTPQTPAQLQSANPADWPVAPGWQPLADAFFAGARGQVLLAFLQARLQAGAAIFPPQPLRALELTPPEDVRVVILGQDPYHGRGQAEGLAFSVAPGVRLPPSLQNIFKEMQRDLGVAFPPFPNPGGSLVKWAKNGVLLLNTCLTVEEGQAASHAGKGWETAGTWCSRPTTPRPCRHCARLSLLLATGTLARRGIFARSTVTEQGLQHRLRVTRGGVPVDATVPGGAIRLGLPGDDQHAG
jgi:hypothetical protein